MRNMDHHRFTGHVANGTGSPVSFCLILLVLLISGCGGGGGDDDDDSDAAESVQISGAILIPGGSVSAANPIGLKGAANKPVSLYRIDDTGQIIGDVLDTTTSDQNGNYVLLLPADIEYSSDIIVEAEIGPTANDTARAIVLDATTDVTPITEYITQKLINDPTLDMSALPREEVAKLIAFVETLPLPPQPDLSSMLITIATFSNIVVEAEIDDINNTVNQQVRLSGLLSTPGNAGIPRPAPGTAQRSIPAGNEVVELYQIDTDGENILPAIVTIPDIVTTNDEGVFSFLMPMGVSLSGDLRLQAIVDGVTILALVTNEILNINAESHYVATKLLAAPFVAPASLDVNEVLGIVQFVNAATICTEETTLAAQLDEFEDCVGPAVDQQIDNAVNDPPQGTTLNVVVVEDITQAIDISANVTDSDGSVVLSTTTVISGPTDGVLANNNNGTFSYTGFLNYFGPDAFTYTVTDNDGLASANISVTIDVTPDNDAPTGTPRDASATEEVLLVIDISGDVDDVDGTVNPNTTAITTPASNGNLVNNGDGTFNYTGNPDFANTDGFTYTVTDDLGQVSADIAVSITVSNVNDAPRGSTVTASAIEETDTVIGISGNVIDVDGSVDLSLTSISEFPSDGNLTNNFDGTFTYKGNLDYVGPDAFLFIVRDNNNLPSDPILVNIDVIADNDTPTGTALNLNADEDAGTTIDIRASVNDVDSTIDFTTTTVTSGPSSGNLVNNNDGTFTYTGNLDFVGADAFTYTVADDGGQVSEEIGVNVIVDNLNDAPRGTTLVVNADEETLTAFNINSNVIDVDDTVNFTTTTVTGVGPTDGILVNNNDGSFTYTGDLDFFGTDSFTYTVADNIGLASADIRSP